MDEQNKLMEQYDEAAFALLMDRSAEEEGAELLRAFRNASAAGEMPDYTDALDRRCLDSIDREFSKRTRRVRFRRFARAAARAAVVVFAMIGLAGTLIMSVEALRVPVMNYLMLHTDYSSIINFDEIDNTQPSVSVFPSHLMPDGYTEVYSELLDGFPSCMYMNTEGNLIMFYMAPTEGILKFDSEGATVEEIVILDYSAIYVCEDIKRQLLWFDDENLITYSCITEGLSEDEFFSICTNLAKQYADYVN